MPIECVEQFMKKKLKKYSHKPTKWRFSVFFCVFVPFCAIFLFFSLTMRSSTLRAVQNNFEFSLKSFFSQSYLNMIPNRKTSVFVSWQGCWSLGWPARAFLHAWMHVLSGSFQALNWWQKDHPANSLLKPFHLMRLFDLVHSAPKPLSGDCHVESLKSDVDQNPNFQNRGKFAPLLTLNCALSSQLFSVEIIQYRPTR